MSLYCILHHLCATQVMASEILKNDAEKDLLHKERKVVDKNDYHY